MTGQIRYTANAGTTGPTRSPTPCATPAAAAPPRSSPSQISENRAPVATDDTYDIAAGTTLHPAAPGVLGQRHRPRHRRRLQARLVRGVTNGRLLLNSTGSFTYTPNGPGIDTLRVPRRRRVGRGVERCHRHDLRHRARRAADRRQRPVRGAAGPRARPSPLPACWPTTPARTRGSASTVQLAARRGQGHAAAGSPTARSSTRRCPATRASTSSATRVRDSEGRVSAEAHVGITVTSGGPPTATVGATSPADGATILGPTHFTATLAPPAGETVTEWAVSYRRPGSADPRAARHRHRHRGRGRLRPDPGAQRHVRDRHPRRHLGRRGARQRDRRQRRGRVQARPLHDHVPRSSPSTPRTSRSSCSAPTTAPNKAGGDFGAGWSLELANFRIDSNGPLGGGGWSAFTCGSFPFLATCYQSSKPHFVTVTWPDGHVERFRFAPNQGSQLVPNITTAGFVAEPGTTSTLEPSATGCC